MKFENINIADGTCLLSVPSPTFSGAGLNDMSTKGSYTGSSVLSYKVQIDATGTPNTFKWSDDGGATWDATGVSITGAWQTLNNGVQIKFNATTGHTLTDNWSFSTAVSVTENQIGVQMNWSGLDEEVTIVPLQSIDGVNFVGFRDENELGIVWKIGISLSTRLLGSIIEILNGVRCKYLKLKVYVGKATVGTINKIETY